VAMLDHNLTVIEFFKAKKQIKFEAYADADVLRHDY
jgi:hypothetical protein